MDTYDNNKKMLDDYFPNWQPVDDDYIKIDGVTYPIFLNMSPDTDDRQCCRVIVDGDSYYFG